MVHLLLAVIYLSFISLGLPDALLGSAWPTIYGELGVPVSYMGIISMIISAGTVVSSLCSDRLTRRLGAGGVTALAAWASPPPPSSASPSAAPSWPCACGRCPTAWGRAAWTRR